MVNFVVVKHWLSFPSSDLFVDQWLRILFCLNMAICHQNEQNEKKVKCIFMLCHYCNRIRISLKWKHRQTDGRKWLIASDATGCEWWWCCIDFLMILNVQDLQKLSIISWRMMMLRLNKKQTVIIVFCPLENQWCKTWPENRKKNIINNQNKTIILGTATDHYRRHGQTHTYIHTTDKFPVVLPGIHFHYLTHLPGWQSAFGVNSFLFWPYNNECLSSL